MWVTQRLREFLELYPDIRIELVLSDEQIAIAMRAADVAIWTSEPQQSELIRRPLFNMKLHAYASSQYIRRYGAPQSVDALDDHPIISYSGTPAPHLSAIRWLETAGIERQVAAPAGVLRQQRDRHEVCDPRRHRHRPRSPTISTGEETDLVPVLQDAQLPTVPVYFVYPEELKTAKKVQVFRDFLVTKARQWKF